MKENQYHTLIVEDEEKNIDAAKEAFHSKLNLLIATDYDQAVRYISQYNDQLERALCDCYFPKQTGSDNILLGQSVARKLTQGMGEGNNFKDYMDNVKQQLQQIGFQKTWPELEERLAAQKISDGTNIIENDASREALERSLENIGEEKTIDGIKSLYDCMPYTTSSKRAGLFMKDYFAEMISTMTKDPSQQPLGVEVAKELKSYEIPFMFVTSGGHHGSLTQPFEIYANNNDIRISTNIDKTNRFEWQKAYDSIEEVKNGK